MLAYRPDGLLLFACNESGFTKQDVSAICDMNQSTKILLKEGKKSFIGCKGIGSFRLYLRLLKKVETNPLTGFQGFQPSLDQVKQLLLQVRFQQTTRHGRSCVDRIPYLFRKPSHEHHDLP